MLTLLHDPATWRPAYRHRQLTPDGSACDNVSTQNMTMRWARITEIHTLEGNVVLQRALDRIAKAAIPKPTRHPSPTPQPAH
jgi:hypothetical protein